MVDYCANPKCMKPLHYLREGTVYIFEALDVDFGEPNGHRLEHYWLCGDCASTYLLERAGNKELRLAPKKSRQFVRRRTPITSVDPVLVS